MTIDLIFKNSDLFEKPFNFGCKLGLNSEQEQSSNRPQEGLC
jgi:hypothetical protein